MSSPSLATLARELNTELGDIDDDDRRAAEIANALRLQRPDTTTKGRQAAAAKAAGVAAPPTGEEAAALQEEPGRAGRAAKRGRKTAARRFRRARVSTVGGLVAQALGLTALYWVLRFPDSITRAADGLARGFAWLAAPIPLGGGSTLGNPSTGTDGSPITDLQPRR